MKIYNMCSTWNVCRNVWSFILLLLFISSCQKEEDSEKAPLNIVWIVAEDLSPVLPSFGDSTIRTPHLERLAAEGVCYDLAFSPSGVCAPSRAALATGMYPTRIGANHMRTGPWFTNLNDQQIQAYKQRAMPESIPVYEATPRAGVRMMSEYLREVGYYCTNNAKEDYQFRKTVMAWDESSKKAHWKNRAKGQPFFSIFNIEVTHESRIWAKAADTLLVEEDLDVPVPPYLPTTEKSLADVRRMYSNIIEMDRKVGALYKELEDEGLLENTVIFWYSDHGGPLPRQKRLLYDSGLRVPLIIRFPDGKGKGSRSNRLVSFVDFAPTVLSLANVSPPEIMDGQAFLGSYEEDERQYIYAAADRFDETLADPIRAVRDKRYKYIKYYDTNKSMFYPVSYRDQMPIMQELHRLNKIGALNQTQQLWFRAQKPAEELFDVIADPHEINDLSKDIDYMEVKETLKRKLSQWEEEGYTATMNELDVIADLWPNNEQPKAVAPIVDVKNHKLFASSSEEGLTIAYRIKSNDKANRDSWKIYTEPIELGSDRTIEFITDRIGYEPSKIVIYEP